MSLIECICGEKREAEEMAEHLRMEHFESGVDLPFECGVCNFSATSEKKFLAHCVTAEHDPNLDVKTLVRLAILMNNFFRLVFCRKGALM